MKTTKYIRKLSVDREIYGTVGIPAKVCDSWIKKGFTYIEMLYDESTDTMVLKGV